MDTERSAVSIFATRDWLEPIILAKSFCVILSLCRSSFTFLAIQRVWLTPGLRASSYRSVVGRMQLTASLCFNPFVKLLARSW